MNFVNHSSPGSLDSGDALDCITSGIEVARAVLPKLPRAKAAKLAAWIDAAQALLDSTEDPYELRVRAYEAQGMTRSDAQAVVDAEDL